MYAKINLSIHYGVFFYMEINMISSRKHQEAKAEITYKMVISYKRYMISVIKYKQKITLKYSKIRHYDRTSGSV